VEVTAQYFAFECALVLTNMAVTAMLRLKAMTIAGAGHNRASEQFFSVKMM
jgi:hypothetical protein